MEALRLLLYELNYDISELHLRMSALQTNRSKCGSPVEAVGKRHDECQNQSSALASLALPNGFDWAYRELGLHSALSAAIDGFRIPS